MGGGKLSRTPARAVEEGDRFYVVSEERVFCANCGHGEFRVVVDWQGKVHLFCARCGFEHVVAEPPSWEAFYCVSWEE